MRRDVVRKSWRGPKYHVQATFRAPLAYVFRWCTDYTPGDAKLEGETYQRKVIRRSRRHVTLEDMDDSPMGWYWARLEVDLMPPDRWHLVATGNTSEVVADYRLRALAPDRTRLDLWWRRRPSLLKFVRRSKKDAERSSTVGWRHFARALNRDYRKSRAKSPP
jgi:hypothetical protein